MFIVMLYTTNKYERGNKVSKITKVRIINCQSIKDATIEFDSRGIINLKGYNDSGKTAIETCLAVTLYNRYKSKQAKFITDGEEYMRCVIYFDDGVAILRDKYRSGASLYEMYKGEEVIYSTRKGNVLENFEEVPEPIAKYLGVASVEGIMLNFRTEKDPLLLTDTKGSENYKFFHGILHADELVLAAKLLNADKNLKNSELKEKGMQLSLYRQEYNKLYGLHNGIVTKLENLDSNLDGTEKCIQLLEGIITRREELDNSPNIPHIEGIDTRAVELLGSIIESYESLQTTVPPKVESVDTTILSLLGNIIALGDTLSSFEDKPSIEMIDTKKAETLNDIWNLAVKYISSEQSITKMRNELETYHTELAGIEAYLRDQNIKTVRCENCGTLSLVSTE